MKYHQIQCAVCGGFAGAMFSANLPDEPVYCATCAHSIIKLYNTVFNKDYRTHYNYIYTDNNAYDFACKAESVVFKYAMDNSLFENIIKQKPKFTLKTT